VGNFCPPGSGSGFRIRIPNPDPLTRLNPDPIRNVKQHPPPPARQAGYEKRWGIGQQEKSDMTGFFGRAEKQTAVAADANLNNPVALPVNSAAAAPVDPAAAALVLPAVNALVLPAANALVRPAANAPVHRIQPKILMWIRIIELYML